MTLTLEQAHEAYRGLPPQAQAEVTNIMAEPGVIPGDHWDFLFLKVMTRMLRTRQLRRRLRQIEPDYIPCRPGHERCAVDGVECECEQRQLEGMR
jgi:hypothetical protein